MSLLPSVVWAACSNPTGIAGQIVYNQDYHVHQYCNNTTWIAMTAEAGDGGSGAVPTTSGLVANWKLDEGTGTSAADTVGARTGTLTNGPVWASGQMSGAVQFDGSDDLILVSTMTGLPAMNGAMTLSAWFQYATLPSKPEYLISLNDIAGNKVTRIGFASGGAVIAGNFASNSGLVNGSYVPSAGPWHLYTYVSDGTNHRLYIDGVERQTGSGTPDSGSPTSLRIGHSSYSTNNFTGLIDDVRIYNRVLSSIEVRQLYSYGQIGGGTGCLDPAGVEGSVVFNIHDRVPQYCEGDAWKAMGSCITGFNTSLAGRWKLDDGAGLTASDSLVGGSNGTLTNGPSWTTGASAGALDFDGTNDFVDIPPTTGLDIQTNTLTLSAWINPDVTSGLRRIFSMPTSETAGTEKYSLFLSANTLQFAVRTSGDNFLSTAFTTTGTWTHVAGVYNGTTMKLYVNGVAVNSTSATGNIAARVLGNFQIGRYGPTFGQYFDGKINDVRVYSAALSDADVYNLYLSTQPSHLGAEKVAHWGLDESTGTSARDEVGVSPGTTVNTPTWSPTSGKVNGALDFDGADDRVDVGSDTTLDNLAAMTIVAWINPDTLGEGPSLGRIIGKTSTNTTTGGWTLNLDTTNRLTFDVDYATTDLRRRSANNTIALGSWQQVAVTWTGSSTATNAKLYINGVETTYATTTNASGARVDDAAQSVAIGNPPALTDRTFDGKIDDVRIYNRALSPAEIKSLYDSQMAGHGCTSAGVFLYDGTYNLMKFCDGMRWVGFGECTGVSSAGLSGQWKFSEGSGTSTADASGNGLTGTLTSGPTWSGSALSFDGTDDYVAVSDPGVASVLDFGSGDSITITAWINPASLSGYRMIATKNGSNVGGINANYQFQTGGDELTFYFTNAGAWHGIETTALNLSLSQWQLVAFTGTFGSLASHRFYLNGNAYTGGVTTSGTPYTTAPNQANDQLWIGRESAGTFFNGSIDDVRIYKRILGPDEIMNLYVNGRQ